MVMTSTRSLALTMAACAISTCNTQSDVDALKLTGPLSLTRVPSFRRGNGKAKNSKTTSAVPTGAIKLTAEAAAASLPVTTPTGNGVPPAFDGSSTEVNTITILELKDEGNEGLISRIKEDFFRLLAETVRTESTVHRKYTDTEITAYVMMKYIIELQTPLIDMLRKKYEDGKGRPVYLKYKEYFEVDHIGNDDDELYRIPILKQHEFPIEKRGQHEAPIEKNVRLISNELDVKVLYSFGKMTFDESKEINKDRPEEFLECAYKQSDLIINIAFQLIQRFLSKRPIRGRPISDDIENIIGAMRKRNIDIDMTSDESTETISISTSRTIAQDPEKVLSHAQIVRLDEKLDERSSVELKRQAAAVENNIAITVQQDWLKRMEGSITRI